MRFFTYCIASFLLLVITAGSATAQTIIPTLPVAEKAAQGVSHAPPASERFFHIQSVDTMKYSRDRARNPFNEVDIPTLVERVAAMHVTHISISTPYDEEFYPVLKAWVDESRKYNLKIWFRGNWSGFEGWFGYPKMTDPNKHHQLTAAFIRKHPELFEEGDIFTPAPEPENGAIGDPRVSKDKGAAFNQWLVTSYATCVESMEAIGKTTTCGYFSTNGDVAHHITKETYQQIGNIIVIDHYVKDLNRMRNDIITLHTKFGMKVVLGEFGAPILDINGAMTEFEQAYFVKSLFYEFLKVKHIVHGVNYWVIFDGPTSLYKGIGNATTMKHAGYIVKRYYKPVVVKGQIKDTKGHPVAGATVSFSPSLTATTDSNGNYKVLTTRDFLSMTVSKSGYTSKTESISNLLTFVGYESNTFAVTKHMTIKPSTTSTLNFLRFAQPFLVK